MTSRVSDVGVKDEIIRLGPWHHDIEVRPGVSTRVAKDIQYREDVFGRVTFLDWHDQYIAKDAAHLPRWPWWEKRIRLLLQLR